MKKCLKCNGIYNDNLEKCPECDINLVEYTSDDKKRDDKEVLKKQIKTILSIVTLVVAFILGFVFKSCIGIKKTAYDNIRAECGSLKLQYNSLQSRYDDLTKEYYDYKEAMKPYEQQKDADKQAAIAEQPVKEIENTPKPEVNNSDNSQKANTSNSYGNSEAETKRLMQLFLDDFKNTYPDTILKVEAYSDAVFNIWFSNDWYLLNEQEKESVANNLYTSIKNRYIEVSGKSDGIMSLTLYDQNSKTLAKSKTFGGIDLKK